MTSSASAVESGITGWLVSGVKNPRLPKFPSPPPGHTLSFPQGGEAVKFIQKQRPLSFLSSP